jgi:hypothetical protein
MIAIIQEPVIGIPETLIGIVRNPHAFTKSVGHTDTGDSNG